MAPTTTSSADELTLFLTHGSGFAEILDCPYSIGRQCTPPFEPPPTKAPARKTFTARRLALAGLPLVILLLLVCAPKIATQSCENNLAITNHAKPSCQTNLCPAPPRESFGTRVDFLASPQDACRQAAGASKLAFILHVSGYFEDPEFT
jgi:hypothetical protein